MDDLDLNRCTHRTARVLERAAQQALTDELELTPGHVLRALADEPAVQDLVKDAEDHAVSLTRLGQAVGDMVFISPFTEQVLRAAFAGADEMGDAFVTPEHLVIGLQMSGFMPAERNERAVMEAIALHRVVDPPPRVLTPIERLSVEDLVHMEDRLHRRLIGQAAAVTAVSNSVRRAFSGLADQNRPYGSFLFLGPTGVGKTELAKTLTEFMYGSERAYVRIDMAEYEERHTASKLVGAPPGYVGYAEGGQLTNAVLRSPYSLVLLDEMEKAHPDVLNVLLALLDDGRLTDGQGRTVDFSHCVVVMTSNVGSDLYSKPADDVKGEVLKRLFRQFPPEFLNRLDEIVVFDQLTQADFHRIVDLQLQPVVDRMAYFGVTLDVSQDAKEHLVSEGWNQVLGARALRRTIQRKLQDPLALQMIAKPFERGAVCRVRVKDDQLTFRC